MRNLIGLIDAICDAYDRPDFVPRADGVTFCNQAVNAIAQGMGCMTLDGLMADQMIEKIEASDDWSDVPMERVQDMANAGTLVVACATSAQLGQAHGHVCVVRPGKPCFSGKWGAVPRVVNIGAENFLARAKKGPLTGMTCGVNEAFRDIPKFWCWRPSL